MSNNGPKTLFDKIWSDHLVGQRDDGTSLLYIDRHLVHEVTSPQAFEGLKLSNRKVRRPEATFATADHNVPTINRENISDEQSRIQVETLAKNTKEHNIEYFELTASQYRPWTSLQTSENSACFSLIKPILESGLKMPSRFTSKDRQS